MKTYQIHLRLTENLYQSLKEKAGIMGLPTTHYVKFILVREVGAYALDLNIRTIHKNEVFEKEGTTYISAPSPENSNKDDVPF